MYTNKIMIIYNTTYQIDPSVLDEALSWIRLELIPSLLSSEHLKNPRLVRVMTDDKLNHSYSLQFEIESVEMLNDWYRKHGASIYAGLTKKYGNNLLGFTTLLENIEL